MNTCIIRILTVFMVLANCSFESADAAASAAADATLLRAKQDAEAKGYVFETSHDAIVEKARKEGSVRGLLGFEDETIKALRDGFKKKYPFINSDFEQITGTDSAQRFLLELQSGRASDWDVAHLSPEKHNEYLPYMAKIELLGMAEKGVLQIPAKMISPDSRNAIALSAIVDVVAYNKKMLPQDRLPRTWEDLLKPEYKGKKFLTDIRPVSISALVPAMGIEWVENFAGKLAAQQPIWTRGQTRYLNAMVAGEYSLFVGTYYHTVMRIKKRGVEDLDALFLEPVPVRMTETHAIVKGARHPYGAMLFLEYVASAEGQRILYDIEPFKSSIYSPGSRMEELVRGKKTSVIDWEHIVRQQDYMNKVFAAYGFPKGEGK